MRRIDHDGHVTRQGRPPFKVLAIPDVAYLPPPLSVVTPPPPPRAPEPYKVVPSSTSSFGRAHRRSSFVILAETRPPTPESAGDASSPTLLLTGRVSPFRGRGFKGPPPRSMSRPQSPEVAAADERRRGRAERRVSVSQQNSPRRSMIPQPTYRQRSTSLTKTGNDRSPSPKIGRRNDSKTNVSNSRNRLNAIDPKRPNDTSRTRLSKFDSRSRANLAEPRTRFISNSTSNLNETRRSSMTMTAPRNAQRTRVTTRLSPIQGTPTKPEKTTSQAAKEERANDSAGLSPPKISTSKTSPRNNAATRKSNRSRPSSKERVTSPSKIPLKMSRTGSFGALNASKAAASTQSSERSGKVDKPANKIVKEGRNDRQQTKQSSSVQDSVGPSRSNSRIDGNPTDGAADEVDLMNLLKQSSSHATSGTSSERLVNTTTTTAVQPLHIDANALSVERNDGSIIAAQQRERPEVAKISPASKDELSVAARRAQNAVATSGKSAPLLPTEGQSIKANQASGNPGGDIRNPGAGGSTDEHSKSGGKGQSARNIAKTNDEAHQRSSNQSSANQRAGKNGQSGAKTSSGATSVGPEVMSTTAAETKSRSKATAGETPASDRMPTVMENSARIAAAETVEGAETKTAATAAAVTTTTSSTAINSSSMSDSTTNGTTTRDKIKTTSNATRSDNNNVNCAIGSTNRACANSGAVRTRNDNRGSDASLKSSTGVSTDSIGSVRSTDTGVSVNTVRVVSSPKVKTGVHVVKRPQEIETLSGNIVHVEQNGEPVAPASGNDKQGDSEKLLARWRRSLSWYCRCCRGMRCLACRRDPKGLLWARNQGRTTAVISDTPPAVATVAQEAPAPAANALSRWSRLKTRCKCTRLRTIKCCTRKARIAPAEPTVCFPPERKFGALCRRMFSCCRCKRADTQQRTRNVRAKHSLTSVAPPPLSEEPKSKLPDILVEHNSVMRGAIPCLPVPLAWFCLVWNVLLPGSGTVWSGLFNLCTGQPRFSAVAGLKSRLGAFIVNLVVGVGQLFTVLFCLVGWGWSIWWGVTMVRLARKYKRFKASEAASNDPEARGGESGVLPPGVPSQALRGMERAR